MTALEKFKQFANKERTTDAGITIPEHLLSEIIDLIEKDNIKETVTNALPEYTCTKKVHAFKINKIEYIPELGLYKLSSENDKFSALVPFLYMSKHIARVGGYYVKYKDNYESFSPSQAFEEGYVLSPENKGFSILPPIYFIECDNGHKIYMTKDEYDKSSDNVLAALIAEYKVTKVNK